MNDMERLLDWPVRNAHPQGNDVVKPHISFSTTITETSLKIVKIVNLNSEKKSITAIEKLNLLPTVL